MADCGLRGDRRDRRRPVARTELRCFRAAHGRGDPRLLSGSRAAGRGARAGLRDVLRPRRAVSHRRRLRSARTPPVGRAVGRTARPARDRPLDLRDRAALGPTAQRRGRDRRRARPVPARARRLRVAVGRRLGAPLPGAGRGGLGVRARPAQAICRPRARRAPPPAWGSSSGRIFCRWRSFRSCR